MGVPMRGAFFRSKQVAGVFMLNVLITYTCFSQERLASHNVGGLELPSAPSAVARVSDTRKDVQIFRTTSLCLSPNDGHSTWEIRSSWNPIRNPPTLGLPARQFVEPVRRDEHSILSALSGWLTFSPTYGHSRPKTIRSADDWQSYARHIPLTAPAALRVDQEAQAHHPHLATVFKVIQPKFW
jgi:hypothetical protein